MLTECNKKIVDYAVLCMHLYALCLENQNPMIHLPKCVSRLKIAGAVRAMSACQGSYIQAIELGRARSTTNSVMTSSCDSESKQTRLKQRQGMPVVWLLQERTVALMPQRISKPILSELRKLRRRPRERLRYQDHSQEKDADDNGRKAPKKRNCQELIMY